MALAAARRARTPWRLRVPNGIDSLEPTSHEVSASGGNPCSERLVVSDDHHDATEGARGFDGVGYALRRGLVETCRGLVKEQERGAVHCGTCKCQSLQLPTRKCARRAIDEAVEPILFAHLSDRIGHARDAIQPREELKGLSAREVGIDQGVVGDEPDGGAHAGAVVWELKVVVQDPACGGLDEGREDGQERGFSCAIGALEGRDRATIKRDGHP